MSVSALEVVSVYENDENTRQILKDQIVSSIESLEKDRSELPRLNFLKRRKLTKQIATMEDVLVDDDAFDVVYEHALTCAAYQFSANSEMPQRQDVTVQAFGDGFFLEFFKNGGAETILKFIEGLARIFGPSLGLVALILCGLFFIPSTANAQWSRQARWTPVRNLVQRVQTVRANRIQSIQSMSCRGTRSFGSTGQFSVRSYGSTGSQSFAPVQMQYWPVESIQSQVPIQSSSWANYQFEPLFIEPSPPKVEASFDDCPNGQCPPPIRDKTITRTVTPKDQLAIVVKRGKPKFRWM